MSQTIITPDSSPDAKVVLLPLSIPLVRVLLDHWTAVVITRCPYKQVIIWTEQGSTIATKVWAQYAIKLFNPQWDLSGNLLNLNTFSAYTALRELCGEDDGVLLVPNANDWILFNNVLPDVLLDCVEEDGVVEKILNTLVLFGSNAGGPWIIFGAMLGWNKQCWFYVFTCCSILSILTLANIFLVLVDVRTNVCFFSVNEKKYYKKLGGKRHQKIWNWGTEWFLCH